MTYMNVNTANNIMSWVRERDNELATYKEYEDCIESRSYRMVDIHHEAETILNHKNK